MFTFFLHRRRIYWVVAPISHCSHVKLLEKGLVKYKIDGIVSSQSPVERNSYNCRFCCTKRQSKGYTLRGLGPKASSALRKLSFPWKSPSLRSPNNKRRSKMWLKTLGINKSQNFLLNRRHRQYSWRLETHFCYERAILRVRFHK